MAHDPADVATEFIRAFGAGDVVAMRTLLAEGVVSYITNAAGGVDRVEGRDGYLAQIDAMNLPSAQFTLSMTQTPVTIGRDLILLMVEVQAHRGDRALHNFAAIVVRVVDGAITEWWMADAKPADSEHFWLSSDGVSPE